jgi:anti-sigma factor RsiW
MTARSRFAAFAASLLLICQVAAGAAPRAELWPKWLAHDDTSTAPIDHNAWNRFLQSYVRVGSDGIARIPYAGVTAADRDRLGPTWRASPLFPSAPIIGGSSLPIGSIFTTS